MEYLSLPPSLPPSLRPSLSSLPHSLSLLAPLQVIDWFEQYAEEFFETHNEIGDTKQIVAAMMSELEEFETSTKVRRMKRKKREV